MSKPMRMTIGRAVALASAVVLTVGFSPARADAAIGSMTAQLTIYRLPGKLCGWVVSGVVRMPQAEAQNLLNNQGYRVIFDGWGDDPLSDNFIFGPDPASVYASAGGIAFKGSRRLPCSKNDEDDSTFDEHDELYAGVRLVKGYRNGVYGPTLRSEETNRIGGYF